MQHPKKQAASEPKPSAYPNQNQAYQHHDQPYPPANQGYQQPNQEYPQPNKEYPQPSQGYQQPNAPPMPTIQYQPQGSSTTALISHQGKPPPEDYLMPTIFTTLFCCWPIGIFAILKAIKCRDAKTRGDVTEAEALSKSARKLMHWTVGVGVATYIILMALFFVMMVYVIHLSMKMEGMKAPEMDDEN